MFYNIIPDFSPVMAAKVKYRFEIAKIMTDRFMKDYYIPAGGINHISCHLFKE
jgi:hypothetical protein